MRRGSSEGEMVAADGGAPAGVAPSGAPPEAEPSAERSSKRLESVASSMAGALLLDGFLVVDRAGVDLPEQAELLSCSGCGVVGVEEEDAAFFTGLMSVDLSDNALRELAPLAAFPGIRDLNLACNQLADCAVPALLAPSAAGTLPFAALQVRPALHTSARLCARCGTPRAESLHTVRIRCACDGIVATSGNFTVLVSFLKTSVDGRGWLSTQPGT